MREKVSRVSCDRCKSVIRERSDGGANGTGKQSDEEPAATKVYFEISGHLVSKVKGVDACPISFDDLCDKCVKRVISLVEAIVKSGKGKGKKSKGRKTTNTKPPNDSSQPTPAPA